MEWVETTGKTVEEALEAALDELGVDEADAEYEVLEEPKTGLFGRLRSEARVRARVRPTSPRPKDERRSRARKAARPAADAEPATTPIAATDAELFIEATADAEAPDELAAATVAAAPRRNTAPRVRAERAPSAKATAASAGSSNESESDVSDVESTMALSEQGAVATAFLRGVLERFGAPAADVTAHELDEETVELRVTGADLGLLIGPKGATLQSLQELTRSAVQRRSGARVGRILVDIGGYRQRRKEALERFAASIAADVQSGGTAIVLEPMSPADRKIVHDTVNGIDGVTTSSEGEEPRRRVVVSPA